MFKKTSVATLYVIQRNPHGRITQPEASRSKSVVMKHNPRKKKFGKDRMKGIEIYRAENHEKTIFWKWNSDETNVEWNGME